MHKPDLSKKMIWINSLGYWNENRSPDLGKKARPRIKYRKKTVSSPRYCLSRGLCREDEIIIIIFIIIIRAFHVSVSRWFFTEVWVIASLLKSPGRSTRPPTSKSSSPISNPLVTVPNAPITIDIIVTFMFLSFIISLTRSRYLSFFSHSFCFILWSAGAAKSTILQIFFFFCWLLLNLVFWPRLGDPCICRSPIGVYVCHFLGQVLGCAYTICLYGQI